MKTTDQMNAYKNVILFFGISFLFTWFGNLGDMIFPSDFWPKPMFALGPIIAAPLVIGFSEGKSGLKRWLKRVMFFRAPLSIYLIAFFIPVLIILTSVGLSILFGAIHFPGIGEVVSWASKNGGWLLLIFIPLDVLNGPLPEEPSFRGYGQYELQQKLSPFRSSLWIGLGVLIWHIPVIATRQVPWPIIIALPAVSVVYAWFFQNGKSIWPLILLHFLQNTVGGGFFGGLYNQEENTIWIGFLSGFYVLWAIIIVWRFGLSLDGKECKNMLSTKIDFTRLN